MYIITYILHINTDIKTNYNFISFILGWIFLETQIYIQKKFINLILKYFQKILYII